MGEGTVEAIIPNREGPLPKLGACPKRCILLTYAGMVTAEGVPPYMCALLAPDGLAASILAEKQDGPNIRNHLPPEVDCPAGITAVVSVPHIKGPQDTGDPSLQ